MQDSTNYQKLFISMRYRLLGQAQSDKNYLLALKALEYAKHIHTGLRKDKTTPEFQHQLEIAHYLHTISGHLTYPAQTLAASFLHDVPEDYDISFTELEKLFGEQICHSVELLTKKYKGNQKEATEYFTSISKDAIASVVKGADRINNHQSMIGVFNNEKIQRYMSETKEHIVPMLKIARREFVEQEAAYENIKFMLQSQMALISHYLKDKESGDGAKGGASDGNAKIVGKPKT